MNIKVREKNSTKFKEGKILLASKNELPIKKNNWTFNWREIYNLNKKALFYKLIIDEEPNIIQSIASFYTTEYGLLYMSQIESSYQNKSSNGKYEAVASLIAFGCKLSFNIKEPYKGYLGFTSKSNLIDLYKNKYGAKSIGSSQIMFIEPKESIKLINYYLLGD